MADLNVDIVTPERGVFSGPALEVRVPGWEGQFGVLPGHDAFLALLRAGICTVVGTDSQETRYVLGRGFAEAGAEKVTLLTDSCELVAEVDKAAAKEALAAAEADAAKADPLSEAYRAAKARAELAQARIEA